QKICKRPLLHAPIASPYTTSSISPKTLYISPSTPFASTIKRVRTLLSHIESRASGPISFSSKLGPQITAGIKARRDGSKEEVILKGTGRAIEKVLGIAVYWQGQADVVVRVRTGSVGAVDDVVENGNDEVETGESRVRRTSCLEVGISLR
ncbi:Rpp20 subunit of nuclear RNase MRP and P-domain-containing protein, partial [Calycina marina]